MVHEVNLDGEVIHIQSLELPQSENKTAEAGEEETKTKVEVPENASNNQGSGSVLTTEEKMDVSPDQVQPEEKTEKQVVEPEAEEEETSEPWPESFTTSLTPYLSETLIQQLKQMYLEGPEPPFVSDNGWGNRTAPDSESATIAAPEENEEKDAEDVSSTTRNDGGRRGRGGRRGQDRGRGRGRDRGRRSGRNQREDKRRVISEVCSKYFFALPFTLFIYFFSRLSLWNQKRPGLLYIRSFVNYLKAN